ncbi:DUF423 domain-containing protein [Roseibium hamelinense]
MLGGLAGAAGVALLALSAHADSTGVLETAAQMLLFHAPVILGIGVITLLRRVPLLPFALFGLVAGLLLFCGDLASRVFLESRLFAMSAPTGGTLIIASWLTLALSALRIRPR